MGINLLPQAERDELAVEDSLARLEECVQGDTNLEEAYKAAKGLINTLEQDQQRRIYLLQKAGTLVIPNCLPNQYEFAINVLDDLQALDREAQALKIPGYKPSLDPSLLRD